MRHCYPATRKQMKSSRKKEQILRKQAEIKEEIGEVAFRRLMVMKMMKQQEKKTGGESLFPDENGFDSLQRVNTLDAAKSSELHDERAKSAVESCINKMHVGAVVDVTETKRLALNLGMFSKECKLLFDECAKSVAELCIKKLRFGALVDKLDKRTILENEIAEARKTRKGLEKRLKAFTRNVRVNELTSRTRQDSRVSVMLQAEMRECGLSGEKVRRRTGKTKGSALEKESYKVLMEMMKGVKTEGEEEELGRVVDEAIALVDEWIVARFDEWLMKLCVGVLVDKRSILEVFKSEITEAWKMEKDVKDKLVIYEMKHAGARAPAQKVTVERKNGMVRAEMSFFATCIFAVVGGFVVGAGLGKAKGEW